MIKPGQFFETGGLLNGYMGMTKECISVSGGRVYYRRRASNSPDSPDWPGRKAASDQAAYDAAPPEHCRVTSIATITDTQEEMNDLREAVSRWRQKIGEAKRVIESEMGLQMLQECEAIRAKHSGITGGQQ
jgi:hypothetical protein